MPSFARLVAIDAYTDPDGLFPKAGAPPAILETLRSLDAPAGAAPLAPVILCQDAGAARARGALLVTDDQDGWVIVLPHGLSADALAAIAAAHAWRRDTTCHVELVAAGAPAGSGRDIAPRLVCEGPAFHPSRLRGCLVPSDWLMLAIKSGDVL